MMLVYVSPLPLFLVGLSRGFTGALVASATAVVAVLIGANTLVAALFLLLAVGPVLIVTRQGLLTRPGAAPGAVEWYPPGLLLGWLTAYGLLILAGALIWFAGRPGGLEGVLLAQLEVVFDRIVGQPLLPGQREALGMFARILPGMMVCVWLLFDVACAVLAQALLTRYGHARRPTPAFGALDLPRWMAPAGAMALMLAFLPGQFRTVGVSTAFILATPFFLLGLSVVHMALERLNARGALRALVYVLVVIIVLRLIWPAIFLVILGIIEQWVQLRRRLAPPSAAREDE
jgi:hypothetical protein